MNALKNIFFLALCLLIGLGIGRGFVYLKNRGGNVDKGFEKHEDPPRQTGVGDAPGKRGFTLQAGDLASLPALLKEYDGLFATTVGLEYGPSITKAALVGAVKQAHQHGMNFVLLPPPGFNSGNPYPRPLKEIAAEAQEAGADFLCISWLKTEPDETYWKQQAAEVRTAFQGRVILAATPDVLPWITFWQSVDVVGAIGPVAIAHRQGAPDSALEVKDLRVAWDSAISSMESLARINGRKLALLRMNVPPAPAGDAAVQKLAYEALLIETKGRAEITEILLFNWGAADFPRKLVEAKIADAWDPSKPKPRDSVSDASDARENEAGDGDGG
jgi:hypothetical protein